MSRRSVLVWGEALVDLVPAGEGGPPEAVLGGSGFNTALAMARCGANVAYSASLSRDEPGRRFRARLDAEGVDRRLVGDCDAPTPSATVESIDGDGVARYRFSLGGTAFDVAPPEPADLSAFAHLHVTSFGATLGASGAGALALMRRARAAGTSLSYDLNIRPPALPGRPAAPEAVLGRAALCDIVRFSAEDAAWLCGSVATLLAALGQAGAPLRLATDGGRGATLHGLAGGPLAVPAPAATVVDTIGAGDAFTGAFLAALAQADALGPTLATLPRETAWWALGFAARVAAATCAVRGCDPPRLRPEPAP